MATAAQIEANRRNAQMSTGPKTAAGKAKASLNALKHGERAKAAAPVLPQEDPAELDAKIRRWVEDLQPVGRRRARPGGAGGQALLAARPRPSGARPPGWPCGCGRPSSRRTWRPSSRSATWAASCCTTPGRGSCPSPGPPGTTTRPPSCAGSSPPPRAAAGCWSGGRCSATCSSAGPSGRSPTCTGRSGCRASTRSTRSTTRSSTSRSRPGR